MSKIYKDLKILIVDDDPQARGFAQKCLLELGFQDQFIFFAFDGLEAKKILESNPQNVELMLIDMVMPQMSGLELLTWMNSQNNEIKKIPKIILSSQEEQSIIVQAVKLGAKNYVVKPVDAKTLAKKIISTFNEYN